jgi:hypothetical protein
MTEQSMPRDPFSPAMQRLAAASGLGFVLFIVLAILFEGGSRPEYDAPVAEFSTYARDNQDEVQLSSVLIGLAAFQLLWFAGYLRSRLGAAEEAARGFSRLAHVVFAGGIVGSAGLVLTASLSAAAVSLPDDTSADVVRAVHQVAQWPFAVAAVGLAAMLYTASFLILRIGSLPRWLGVVALAGGLAYVLTLFAQLRPEDDGGAFGVFYPVGFGALVVFVVGTSVAFVRELGRTTPSAAG